MPHQDHGVTYPEPGDRTSFTDDDGEEFLGTVKGWDERAGVCEIEWDTGGEFLSPWLTIAEMEQHPTVDGGWLVMARDRREDG